MKTRRIALRLALALTLWNIAILLLTAPRGHEREVDAAWRSQRRALCETVAVSSALLAGRQDWAGLEQTLAEIAARHPELLSTTVARADGRVVAAVGQRGGRSRRPAGSDADIRQISVPLWAGQEPWGAMTMQLADAGSRGAGRWWQSPQVHQAFCVTLMSSVMLFLVFWAMLRRLDPSVARGQLAAARAETARLRGELDKLRESVARPPASAPATTPVPAQLPVQEVQSTPTGHPPWLPASDTIALPTIETSCDLV